MLTMLVIMCSTSSQVLLSYDILPWDIYRCLRHLGRLRRTPLLSSLALLAVRLLRSLSFLQRVLEAPMLVCAMGCTILLETLGRRGGLCLIFRTDAAKLRLYTRFLREVAILAFFAKTWRPKRVKAVFSRIHCRCSR